MATLFNMGNPYLVLGRTNLAHFERFNENGVRTDEIGHHKELICQITKKVIEQFLYKWRRHLTWEIPISTRA